ncbi:hypothetical protein [Streptomyces sp. NPDC005167]
MLRSPTTSGTHPSPTTAGSGTPAGHQSAVGATAAVLSYPHSARKHGLSAVEAIPRALSDNNLWMPPTEQVA